MNLVSKIGKKYTAEKLTLWFLKRRERMLLLGLQKTVDATDFVVVVVAICLR